MAANGQEETTEDIITSAILVACEEGNLAALEELANVHRLNLNVANRLGETAMHVSSGAGYEQLVVYLQARGCPTEVEDRRGDTPLFWAARNGHAHLVRYFVSSKNPVNINRVNRNKETALHVATRYAQMESVLALLENGADIDIQDEHGETALHIASWHGYALLLSILCRFNPKMDLLNQNNFTTALCGRKYASVVISLFFFHFYPQICQFSHYFNSSSKFPHRLNFS